MQFHATMLIFQREKVSKEDKDKRMRRKVVEPSYLATMLNLLTRSQAYSFLIDSSLFPLYPSIWKFHGSHENLLKNIRSILTIYQFLHVHFLISLLIFIFLFWYSFPYVMIFSEKIFDQYRFFYVSIHIVLCSKVKQYIHHYTVREINFFKLR